MKALWRIVKGRNNGIELIYLGIYFNGGQIEIKF